MRDWVSRWVSQCWTKFRLRSIRPPQSQSGPNNISVCWWITTSSWKIGSIVFIQDHSGKLFLRTFFFFLCFLGFFLQFLTRRGLTTHKQANTHLRNMIASPQLLELSKNPVQVHNGLRVMMFWRCAGKGSVTQWMSEWMTELFVKQPWLNRVC